MTGAADSEHDARSLALSILNRLDREPRHLDGVMETALTASPLPRREVALTYALVYGVLRWRGRLDYILSRFSKTPIAKIDPPILNILRMGTFQILHLDRIPDSAAVNTAVNLAKTVAPKWVVRFVNGVLRNVGRQGREIRFPDSQKDPAAAVSAEAAFPRWLVERWIQRYGAEDARSLCDAVNALPPVTLRTNTLRTDRSKLMDALSDAAEKRVPTPRAPEGVALYGLRSAVFDLPGYADGHFQVQDEAAQLVAHLAAPRPGERILDACAGLGGKTGHLAQLMDNRGEIVAADRDETKLERLKTEMDRLGVGIVATRRVNLDDPPDPDAWGTFDRILVDAPCSGLGVLRRNPDGKWRTRPEDLANHHKRQVRFLNHLAPLVNPAGRLVYAVCSFEPEETDAVATAFSEAHPEFRIVAEAESFPEPARSLIDSAGCFRSLPHRAEMDGFFAVCFQKDGR